MFHGRDINFTNECPPQQFNDFILQVEAGRDHAVEGIWCNLILGDTQVQPGGMQWGNGEKALLCDTRHSFAVLW